ncbi:MAG: aldo/keto reductase, partial [Bacteroidota bacterium]|nr:aldo/keto reductase [Bacteroidota bacterium]
MKYRELGNSGVKITEITFGAWAIGGWMWGGADKKDAIAAIHKSLDLGITSIDTAPVYGFGTSESIVGEALSGNRAEVQLLTKFGLRWDTDEGEFYFDSKDNSGKE